VAKDYGTDEEEDSKTYTTKKARTFNKENMETYHAIPDTPETLLRKAHAVVSLGVSGRTTEVMTLEMDVIKMLHDEEGKPFILISSQKLKRTEARTEAFDQENTSWITASMEVECLERYLDCFEPEARTGK